MHMYTYTSLKGVRGEDASYEGRLGKEKRKCFVEQFWGYVVAFRHSAVLLGGWREPFCCRTNSRSGSESELAPEGAQKGKDTHSTVCLFSSIS